MKDVIQFHSSGDQININSLPWMLTEKKRIVKICKEIQEGNYAMKDVIQFHSNRDQIIIKSLPWILTEQQSNVVK